MKKTVGGATTYYIGNWYEVTNGVVTKYYYFGAQRVAMKQGSAVTYLHSDHLGSTSVASNASGALIARQTYYAYGVPRTTEGTLPTDYTFTGQKNDTSSSLLFYNARYYDAYLNRFIQPDTIVPNPGNPQSLNRYAYAYNNPVRYYDSDGHCFPFCEIATYAVLRNIPREAFAAGARFVAGLHVPVVSDFAALDVANADNLWSAVNGDKIGLSPTQRIEAYGKYVVGGVIEGGAILYGAATVETVLGGSGACAATDCVNKVKTGLNGIATTAVPTENPSAQVTIIGARDDVAAVAKMFPGEVNYLKMPEAGQPGGWTREINLEWMRRAWERGNELWRVSSNLDPQSFTHEEIKYAQELGWKIWEEFIK